MLKRSFAAAACALIGSASAFGWSFSDAAAAHPAYRGRVPAKSDVVFSARARRPDALDVANQFGATRSEWTYLQDGDFVRELRSKIPWVGASVNSVVPAAAENVAARSFDGQALAPPWMAAWNVYWLSTTNVGAQRIMAKRVSDAVRYGADSIQVDDANFQYNSALFQGGDFGSDTLLGFKEFLSGRTDPVIKSSGLDKFEGDYREFLRERFDVQSTADYQKRLQSIPTTPLWLAYIRHTVAQQFQRMRAEAAKYGKPDMPFSANLGTLVWPDSNHPLYHVAKQVDYSISETDASSPDELIVIARTMRALGLDWVPSILPKGPEENRRAIALAYGLGGQPVIPWDMYAGNDENGKARRYYGSVNEYADLYKFARTNGKALDGHEETPLVGVVLMPNRYQRTVTESLVRTLVARQIPFAFVLIEPGTGQRVDADYRKFALVVSTNDAGDYEEADARELRKAGARFVKSAPLSGAELDAIQPLKIAGEPNVRVFIRASPQQPSELVLHVIDMDRGSSAKAAGCDRTLAIGDILTAPKSILGATWSDGQSSVAVKPVRQKLGTVIRIPTCPLWGLLSIKTE